MSLPESGTFGSPLGRKVRSPRCGQQRGRRPTITYGPGRQATALELRFQFRGHSWTLAYCLLSADKGEVIGDGWEPK